MIVRSAFNAGKLVDPQHTDQAPDSMHMLLHMRAQVQFLLCAVKIFSAASSKREGYQGLPCRWVGFEVPPVPLVGGSSSKHQVDRLQGVRKRSMRLEDMNSTTPGYRQ
jgi:hypothetical protein